MLSDAESKHRVLKDAEAGRLCPAHLCASLRTCADISIELFHTVDVETTNEHPGLQIPSRPDCDRECESQ